MRREILGPATSLRRIKRSQAYFPRISVPLIHLTSRWLSQLPIATPLSRSVRNARRSKEVCTCGAFGMATNRKASGTITKTSVVLPSWQPVLTRYSTTRKGQSQDGSRGNLIHARNCFSPGQSVAPVHHCQFLRLG